MATRRPPPSRTKTRSDTNSIQLARPRSVIGKPVASSSRISDDLESSHDPAQRPRNKEDGETNIQVILRCRGRSEREIQENSTAIVQIEGPKSNNLTIESSLPVSSLGVFNSPPTRTYPFDLVFGPEATQSMVYHEVVGPMLAEVLMGYNCTLFAYGQTGTGKTYTMQGDLSPTPMGNPSSHAGVIPRVLFRLFHELEKSFTDFVVKVSFVELYNEELRDLLANDLSAPTAFTQPMGMAAKDAKAADGGLKIFDEANKRGVFIQGLEEIAVKDSTHALALLTKGSERRQIAATKFNDHSSRSHSVFTITVHLKEKNNMGDDLLKVGKLNLVDLAGSENIGRSGAENKRAREAGMINQSLLTLGRVINALVDKTQHVPYRESKLTRLLQDSLGGRTKTCIIATISPARSNLEETLSTLDYALRAKSIKNKPELNQRLNRNSLLREYVTEIDRLKSDLLAVREKNGIYFSEESWNQMNAENELRRTELVEAKKQVAIIENQLRNVRDEFDQSIALLKQKEQELHTTRSQLQQKEETLQQREVELRQVVKAYNEEAIVCQAHQQTEVTLNKVALGLKSTAAQGLRDIETLFEKLERKNSIFETNRKAVSDSQKLIHLGTNSLMQKLAEMSQLSQSLRTNLEQETKRFFAVQEKEHTGHNHQLNSHIATAQELLKEMKNQQRVEDDSLVLVETELQSATLAFSKEVSSWSGKLASTCSQLCKESNNTTTKQIGLLNQSISILQSLIGSICSEIQHYLKEERDELMKSNELTKNLAAEEIDHLKRQNETLVKWVIDERKSSEKAQADILQRFSGLLGEFFRQRDEALRESIGNLQRSNMEIEDLLASAGKRQAKDREEMLHRNDDISDHLREFEKQGHEAKKKGAQNTRKLQEVVDDGLQRMQRTVLDSVSSHTHWTNNRSEELRKSYSQAFESHSRAKRARIEATDSLGLGIGQIHAKEQSLMKSSSERTEAFTAKALSWIQDEGICATNYENVAMDSLESIERASKNLLSKGIKEDIPSGNTPRKRKWQYVDEWSLTASRQELLSSQSEKENTVVEPTETKDAHLKPAEPDIENETPLTEAAHVSNKVEEMKAGSVALEPLVESRRRNMPRTTRRAR